MFSSYDAQQSRDQVAGLTISPEPVNTYRAEIEEFSQAIIEKRQSANSAELGLQSQKVLAACYESTKTGKVVNVEYV